MDNALKTRGITYWNVENWVLFAPPLSKFLATRLYHSFINTRAQCEIIAWGTAASCHLQPISVVLNRAMRCLSTDKLLTIKVTTIYKMQKILQLKIYTTLKWANSCTNTLPLSFLLRSTIIINSLQMFIHITQEKLKLDNLLYQKRVPSQVLKL